MDVSLALGGGGSKGYAHIGVLRVLEREGFRIGAVAGTSIGGLIGALYLAGFSPDEMQARLSEMDQRHLFARQPDEGPALLGLSNVAEMLEENLGDLTFAELAAPFAVVAVDLITGQECILCEGRLVDAVLATIALPGIFPPRDIGEYHLVDGGLINPVPVSVARSLAPKLPVVAVVLNQPPRPSVEIPETNPLEQVAVLERLARFRLAQAFRIFVRSLDLSSKLLTDLRLKVDKPEVIVRPNLSDVGLLDVVEIDEIAHRGEEAAEAALANIRNAVHWSRRLARRLGMEGWLSRARPDDA